MKSHRITKAFIKNLPVPVKGRPVFYDSEIKGLGIRVSPGGTKTWILLRRVNGKAQLNTLGQFPGLTEKFARKAAEKKIGEIAQDRDPAAERKQAERKAAEKKVAGYTLKEAFQDFKDARQYVMRPLSLRQYANDLKLHFSDWMPKPISSITREAVARRHRKLTTVNGEAAANKAFRELRAIINFAAITKRDSSGNSVLPDNPIKVLADSRQWNRTKRRQGVIAPHEMEAFWNAVESLRDGLVDDLMKVLILTGLRLSEGSGLTWKNVDLVGKTIHVPETKNRQPHTLPMGKYLTALMEQRRAAASGPWVFPGYKGPIKGFAEKSGKIHAAFGRRFLNHDLRRTFCTTIESLDIGWLISKKLMNHSVERDQTAGYTIIDTQRLRKPMQAVEDKILRLAGLKPGGDVVQMPRRNRGRR